MTLSQQKECPGCKALFPDIDGPVHRYMESSPGCWAAFGDVLAREYSDVAYGKVHRLTVDSYAAQHPGQPSRQSIQSVGVHLIRLCLFLEKGLIEEKANSAMLEAAKIKRTFHWLEPPASLGTTTIADVVKADSSESHQQLVLAWARDIWEAWKVHHPTIYSWLPPGY